MSRRIDLVFIWHYHQPDYRHPVDRDSLLPWVRLHATKDYLDMARWLERHPGIHAAFNFVPSLLDQLEDAAAGGGDRLLDLFARPVGSLTTEERREVIWRCAMIPPYARTRWHAFRGQRSRIGGRPREAVVPGRFGDREIVTLECGFLLAWLDPTLHGEPEAARAIEAMGTLTEQHRDDLLALHRRVLGEVVPAYHALAERGQIELSTSPYYHPILPLLVSSEAATRARPDLPLPAARFAAPDDAAAQIERAMARHETVFGHRPMGMWPSEGSVSPEVAEIAAGRGVRWLASDEQVLFRSLGSARRGALYRPWRLKTASGDVGFFFRDHELSDRIGFVYQHMPVKEAVADFMTRLRRVASDHASAHGPAPVVSVILDGENCWEHYEEDGGPFLDALYTTLEAAADVRTRTPREVIDEMGGLRQSDGRTELPGLEPLPGLHSGSWIDADFHIWMGHPEKNRGWDLLSSTRRLLVDAGTSAASHPEAWESLYAAEGSDWFWWFGDDHPTLDKAVFDGIFRSHMQAACERAGLTAPQGLHRPIVRDRVDVGGEPPVGFVRPTVDGRVTHFYEWSGAGHYAFGAGGTSMHRGEGLARTLHYGFDVERFCLRVDFRAGAPGADTDMLIEMHAPSDKRFRVRGLSAGRSDVVWERANGHAQGEAVEGAEACVGRIVEVAVPFRSLGLETGVTLVVVCRLVRGDVTLETLPHGEALSFEVPESTFEAEMWTA